MQHTNFGLHCLLNGGQSTLELSIVRVELQALLVGIVGGQEIAFTVQSSTLSTPTLGPVGLELCRLLGILQGVCVIPLGGVGSGSVAVKNVVFGLDGDSLGELFTVRTC